MTVDTAIAISIVSVAFGVWQGITNIKRNRTQDDKKDAAQLTAVIVKLETIGTGITEIKADLKGNKEDITELRERVAIVESSAKQAHKRLDTIEGAKKRNE